MVRSGRGRQKGWWTVACSGATPRGAMGHWGIGVRSDSFYSPHCHVWFLFSLLHPAASSSAAYNITNTTSSLLRILHYNINNNIINTTSSTHHLHNTINTTPSTLYHQKQHHQHNIINTTPSRQHHQHNTINTSSSTQHHQHNTINTEVRGRNLFWKVTGQVDHATQKRKFLSSCRGNGDQAFSHSQCPNVREPMHLVLDFGRSASLKFSEVGPAACGNVYPRRQHTPMLGDAMWAHHH